MWQWSQICYWATPHTGPPFTPQHPIWPPCLQLRLTQPCLPLTVPSRVCFTLIGQYHLNPSQYPFMHPRRYNHRLGLGMKGKSTRERMHHVARLSSLCGWVWCVKSPQYRCEGSIMLHRCTPNNHHTWATWLIHRACIEIGAMKCMGQTKTYFNT